MRIQAVIFDWAGTVVDYGCHAPVAVLEEIFAAHGVPLLPAECRHAMGMEKRDQIREILRLPRVRNAWRHAAGADPGDADAATIFDAFRPRLLDMVEAYSNVIDGVPETVEWLRVKGVRIGSTTGYTREMIDRIAPNAARQGFAPDCVVTPGDVGQGRPFPWMIFENLRRLGVYPPAACAKVGDTVLDVQEARNAGVISIAVSDSSSEAALRGPIAARSVLLAASPHHLLNSISQLIDLWQIL